MVTPAKKNVTARVLIALAAFVSLTFLAVALTAVMRGRIQVDFTVFYTLGWAVISDPHALVSDVAWMDLQRQVDPSFTNLYPRVYPPFVGLLFAPLTWLTYRVAYAVWSVVALAASLSAIHWLRRVWTPDLSPSFVLLGALSAPALIYATVEGHLSVVGLIAFVMIGIGLSRDRRALAGVGLGLLAYKPTLWLPSIAILVGAGEWALVARSFVTAAVLYTAPMLWLGPAPLVSYVHTLFDILRQPDQLAFTPSYMFSLRTLVSGWLSVPLARATYVALAGAVVIATIVVWRRTADPRRRVALLTVAVVLSTPHLYFYDLIILAPAALMMAADGVWWGTTWVVWASLLGAVVAKATGLQVATIGYLAVFVSLARSADHWAAIGPGPARPCPTSRTRS